VLLIYFVVAWVALAGVIGAAAWLLWPTRAGRTEGQVLLGRPLVTGAVVGIALSLLQYSTQVELHDHDNAAQALQTRLAAKQAERDQEAQNREELLTQLNLRNDLELIDLHGQDLRGLFLARKDLQGANLEGADLASANLDGADLQGAVLAGADLSDASLIGANLDRADVRQASFRGADADRANLDRTLLNNTDFTGADLAGARVETSPDRLPNPYKITPRPIGQVSFSGANLSDADLQGDSLQGSFAHAVLSGANLAHGYFAGDDFTSAMFFHTIAFGAKFCGATIQSAHFAGAGFLDADLAESDARGVQLQGDTEFAGGDVRGADFTGASIRNKVYFPSPDGNGTFAINRDAIAQGMFYRARYDDTTTAPFSLTRRGADLWTESNQAAQDCASDGGILRQTPHLMLSGWGRLPRRLAHDNKAILELNFIEGCQDLATAERDCLTLSRRVLGLPEHAWRQEPTILATGLCFSLPRAERSRCRRVSSRYLARLSRLT
jgi:uncharacterized protein YjbI with pentapeptide repeats